MQSPLPKTMGAKGSVLRSPRGGGGKKRGGGAAAAPVVSGAGASPSSSSTAASAHAAGEYDEIVAWLEWQFKKSDLNKDGSLDYHEFVRFVRSLNLNMGTKEVFQFFTMADVNDDYKIVWSEVEQDVPHILAKIYEAVAPGPQDWCTMVLPAGDADRHDAAAAMAKSKEQQEDEAVVYFNKRTSKVRRVRPPEMDAPPPTPEERALLLAAPVAAAGSSSSSGGAAAAAKREQVLENTQTLDVTVTWLDFEFKKADYDKNGVLSRTEFAAFVHGLRIGLAERDIERFVKLADSNGDGVVEWVEVLELTPLILKKLYSAIEPGPYDWCLITSANGDVRVFYLNKRTGATQAEAPPGFVPPEEEVEAAARRKSEAKASVVELPSGVLRSMDSLSRSSSASGIGPDVVDLNGEEASLVSGASALVPRDGGEKHQQHRDQGEQQHGPPPESV